MDEKELWLRFKQLYRQLNRYSVSTLNDRDNKIYFSVDVGEDHWIAMGSENPRWDVIRESGWAALCEYDPAFTVIRLMYI